MRVLVLDDEPDVREGVGARLRREGHVVREVGTLAEASNALLEGPFDVLILDRQLPDGDVVDTLPRWQKDGVEARVLLLTASASVRDRVDGLSAGADDYLTKPFALAELVARVAALGRRPAAPPVERIEVADLTIDLSAREVRRAGVLLPLRPKEFALLEALGRRSPRPVPRDTLRALVWDDPLPSGSNVDEVTVASLRRKLGKPSLIRTIRFVGWSLSAED